MPGVALNLDLPSLSDNLATIVSKLVTAVSTLETDVEGMILPSEININSALTMNGAALTDVGSVQLVDGNQPSTPGAFFYHDGEFWVIDSAGLIRLTVGGSLDASSIGGFTNLVQPAAATWDAASQEFRFTADTGVHADLTADDLILYGSAGSVRFGVDSAINSARQFIIKSLPASGKSLLVYNAATSTLEDGAVTAPTNALLGPLSLTGNLTVSGDYKFTTKRVCSMAPLPANRLDTCALSTGDYQSLGTSGAWNWVSRSLPLHSGDRITDIGFRITAHGSVFDNVTLVLKKMSAAGVVSTIHSFAQQMVTVTAYTQAVTTPSALTDGEYYFFTASGDSTGDVFSNINYSYDHNP